MTANATNKKVLFKIPSEDELQAVSTVAEADVGYLPVIEPDPVATESIDNVPTPKPVRAKTEPKPVEVEPVLEEKLLFKKPKLEVGATKVKKDEPLHPLLHPAPPELSKQERHDRAEARKEERLAKQRQLTSIDHIDGISIGSRMSMTPKTNKRTARDRRTEEFERRKALEVTVDGEKKELSETSKYMLDMLLKDEEKE